MKLKMFNLASRKILFILILTGSGSAVYSGSPEKKFSDRIHGLPYIKVSGGIGVWHKSLQDGAENLLIPYSVFLEYGRTSYPFSLVAGTVLHTTYKIDRFQMNPSNLLVGIQYSPLLGLPVSKKFNIYGIGGFNVSYSRFTEHVYPGIINYEYKMERKAGIGLSAGAGAGYRIKSWEIKPLLLYITGHSGFFAGHFTEQRYNTGSLQFHLSLNYRFILNKNNRTCPVYHKFLSF